MAKKIFTTILILAAFCHAAAGQDALFDKYAGRKGVTVVTVSKQMLDMMPELNMMPTDMEGVAGKLESLRVLKCNDRKLSGAISDEAMQCVRHGFEKLIAVDKDGTRNSIFMRKTGKGKSDMMVVVSAGNNLTVVYMSGSMTLEDLSGLTKD